MKYYEERDFQPIAMMYTKDCRFMPAGFPLQEGRDGIFVHILVAILDKYRSFNPFKLHLGSFPLVESVVIFL